jgi:membrane-associated phospholipid phosphatase
MPPWQIPNRAVITLQYPRFTTGCVISLQSAHGSLSNNVTAMRYIALRVWSVESACLRCRAGHPVGRANHTVQQRTGDRRGRILILFCRNGMHKRSHDQDMRRLPSRLRTASQDSSACVLVGASVVVTIALRDLATVLRWNHERIRISTVALVTLAVGPGLLVNGYMKEFIGRPRPADTILFGGDHPFVAAAEWSQACYHNCSFISGEASGIAWIICLLPLWPHRERLRLFWPMTAIVGVTGMLRVAFGRHYLSDVILGSLSTLVVFAAIACLSEVLTSRFDPIPDNRR